MIRTIIQIDENRCDGCGLCVSACHEGALGLVGGKAKLLRDDYCDGMGDCLPACPQDAISFVEREALAYDEAAVLRNQKLRHAMGGKTRATGGKAAEVPTTDLRPEVGGGFSAEPSELVSELRNWPVQIKLAPPVAPYFDGCDLLIAADCTAFAFGGFHGRFMRGRATLIGCPKLDAVDYAEKLAVILRENDIRSVTVVRMQVPCCGGIEMAVRRALEVSGKDIPFDVFVLTTNGEVL